MSTSETIELLIGKCPCGRGQIMKSITTQDNPWSGADYHTFIQCAKCANEWRIEHNHLVKIGSDTEAKAAWDREMNCRIARNKMLSDLVEQYFVRLAAKTRKAEHAEMMRLGIASGSYRDFLKRRSEGRTRGQIANLHGNEGWISQIVREASKEAEFTRLKGALEQAETEREAAGRKIVRRPLSNTETG
jgi:hypothetical protein